MVSICQEDLSLVFFAFFWFLLCFTTAKLFFRNCHTIFTFGYAQGYSYTNTRPYKLIHTYMCVRGLASLDCGQSHTLVIIRSLVKKTTTLDLVHWYKGCLIMVLTTHEKQYQILQEKPAWFKAYRVACSSPGYWQLVFQLIFKCITILARHRPNFFVHFGNFAWMYRWSVLVYECKSLLRKLFHAISRSILGV